MLDRVSTVVFAVSYLTLCHALTLPPVYPTNILPNRTNASILSNSSGLDIPLYFTVETTVLSAGGPMDEIGVYMNAVAAMEAICLRFEERGRIDGDWSLPQYDVAIHMSASKQPPDSIAAWGLQRTVAAVVGLHFLPVRGKFLWWGLDQGYVVIGHQTSGRSGLGGDAKDVSLTVDDDDEFSTNTSTTAIGPPLQANHQLEVVPSYRGVRMTPGLVFATALAVMVAGDEQGAENPCTGIEQPDFQLVPKRDRGMRPLVRWRHVIKAMRLLTRWMVAQDRFEEVDFSILRDGRLIAKGRLRLPGPFGGVAVE